jgi:hypothetical protein
MDFFHETNPFWVYIKAQWLSKTEMWVVDHLNLSYVGQDTNVSIESFHFNLKATLKASKGRALGRHVDWTIHMLMGDVLSHYWYQSI